MGTIIQDESQATTAAYVTIASTRVTGEFAKLLFHVFETGGAQSITYRIQASNDVDFDGVETLADQAGNTSWTIAASGSDYQSLCDCWGWVRVQVINGSGIGAARCIISGGN